MKKITRFAVDYPVTVSMMVLAILLLGIISLRKLGVDLFPEINAPRIFVEIKAGERPPEEMEKQFVESMEALAIRQKGVSDVSSVCMVGSARLTVEYNWGTDMDEAFLDLQKAMASISQNSGIDDFNITQHDPNTAPVMTIAMRHPDIDDMDELRRTGENYIRNELVRLEGIADVVLTGTEERELAIETSQYALDAYGLTTDQIVQQIQSMNRTVSGGTVVDMGKKYVIKGTGLLEDKKDLENLVVAYRDPQQTTLTAATGSASSSNSVSNRVPVFLKDVATVTFINREPDNIVRYNGKRSVGLLVYKETGFNTVKAVKSLKEALGNIEKALPGYSFTVIQNQGSFIQNAVNEVEDTALLGILIAVFVLFLFLRRLGVTLIVSLAIPVSVIATFNLMYFNGLTLNIMTLGGLALGAGMLVDNAIVVMENIFRNLENGMSVKEAAIQGTSQVGGAIIASTITTIVVFLPIVYLSGASSALFRDQAWTVAFSLLASLFVAILVIPMVFHQFYGRKNKVNTFKSVRITWYGNLLTRILERRGIVLVAAILLLAVTAFILPRVGSEYLPRSGTGEFTVDLTLPEGTQLERTSATVGNIEQMLTGLLGNKLEKLYSQIGPVNAGSSEKAVFRNENTASIKVVLKPGLLEQSNDIVAAVNEMLTDIPGVEVQIVRDESALTATMGTDEPPMIVEVKGKDLGELELLTNAVKEKLTALPELVNVVTSIEKGAPELDVIIDRYKASQYGLTADGITSQLKDQLMGKDAGRFDDEGEMKDIVVKLPAITLTTFNNLTIRGNNQRVPLSEVARIRKSQSPRQLIRHNQNRIGRVTADIQGKNAFDKIVDRVKGKLAELDVPGGYQVKVTGEEQKRQQAMSSLGFALILSVILVYMVMASQFESLIHPFTILLTIPLAGVGVVWAFFLLGKSFNMMAYIGIIMLGGIAVNDSIILVDAINQLKAAGKSLKDAIVEAGEHRIRPIIMTSLTTILALFPLTFGFGESAALRAPMAIAVIAGLISSTLLTLVVIPCVYYVFDRKGKRIKTQPVTSSLPNENL